MISQPPSISLIIKDSYRCQSVISPVLLHFHVPSSFADSPCFHHNKPPLEIRCSTVPNDCYHLLYQVSPVQFLVSRLDFWFYRFTVWIFGITGSQIKFWFLMIT